MRVPEDPYVRELLPEFVDSWIEDLKNQLPELLNTKNDTDLYRLAHTLKGSCLQFGLDEIAQTGIELMGHAKDQNWEEAALYESKLTDAFAEVRKMLDNGELI